DRAEGVRRRDPRRAGELSAHGAGLAGRGHRRGVLLVLDQQLQGSAGVHPDPAGAAVAFAAHAGARRGRLMAARANLVAALLALVVLALPFSGVIPAYWVTLFNYIG